MRGEDNNGYGCAFPVSSFTPPSSPSSSSSNLSSPRICSSASYPLRRRLFLPVVAASELRTPQTFKIDKSSLVVAEIVYKDQLWAATCLRIRSFYKFRPSYGIDDHKRHLVEREFEALKECVAGKIEGFRRVSCINVTVSLSEISSLSDDLCAALGEDRVVVGTLDLNNCVRLPDEITGKQPQFIKLPGQMRQRQHVATAEAKEGIQNPILSEEEKNRKPSHDRFSSSTKIFMVCLALRAVNSLLVQTYFNPDEHWQALEVAHRIAFGYGHLTWEWKEGIRSYLHPLVFASLYKVLALCHLDTLWFMTKAPRLLQSIFCAVGDLYLYKLSNVLFDDHVARWALFSQLVNWFMFFCFTRTLSNSLETVLTLVGIFYWPCMRVSPNKACSVSRKWGVAVAALACAIRPTSAIIWMYVGLLELFSAHNRLKFIFLEVAPIGVLVLTLTCVVDRMMYGSWIFVPLNFLKFNFLSSGGDYYGTHKWHWYLTQGFPVMLFTFLPYSIAGIIQSKQWKLSGLIAWVLGLYSVLGHKEFRFVLPVLPIALMFSGYAIAAMRMDDSSNGKRNRSSSSHVKGSSKARLGILFLLSSNIPMALYMSLFHQRGTEDVMHYLSKEASNDKVKSILFLMPCHATPYYSTLHHDLPMRFLDCTPSEEKGTLDESDSFMMEPASFALEFASNWSQPSHIVMFDSEERSLREFLISHSFKEIRRFFHAHFKVDRDLQASVVVYALTGQ